LYSVKQLYSPPEKLSIPILSYSKVKPTSPSLTTTPSPPTTLSTRLPFHHTRLAATHPHPPHPKVRALRARRPPALAHVPDVSQSGRQGASRRRQQPPPNHVPTRPAPELAAKPSATPSPHLPASAPTTAAAAAAAERALQEDTARHAPRRRALPPQQRHPAVRLRRRCPQRRRGRTRPGPRAHHSTPDRANQREVIWEFVTKS